MAKKSLTGQDPKSGNNKQQISFGVVFAEALNRLPKDIRAKLSKAQSQFFNGPFALGLHQEKIHGADDDIYSCRLDQDYRIIYKRPENSAVVVFLYVGKHDEAYTWAEKHCCDVNPFTGSIQVKAAISAKVNRPLESSKPLPRLSKLNDEQLKILNIPEDYWEHLRSKVFLAAHLLGYRSLINEAAYVALEEIVGGASVEDAMDLYATLTEPVNIPVIESRLKIDPLFSSFSDEDLVSVGIPIDYLDLVRTVRTETEINALSGKLPEEAMQSFYALRSGESLESIRKITFADSKPVPEGDFDTAMENPITKSQFAIMEDEEASKAFLESPMEKWRVFLHPSQRRLVERNYAGPARITGGAGTGKTVVIVHRAKTLAKQCTDDEKVLVTTYSRTLADDIEKRLNSICTSAELARIEVSTIETIAYKLAKNLGIKVKYNSNGDLEKLWAEAIGATGKELKFDESFFMAEWQDVIQAQQIVSLERYLTAQRGSRGKRLDKRSREEIWVVFEKYRSICEKKKYADIDFAENRIAKHFSGDSVIHESGLYHSILVDECQDLRAPAFRMIRAIAGKQRQNDLYFSGDARQRIYHGQASLSQCGITINNRSSMLKLNYRTTEEIYDTAIQLQQEYQYDDLDGKILEQDRSICIYHGEKPVIRGFDSLEDEMDAIADDIKTKIASGIPSKDICIMTRVNKWCYGCEKGLAKRGIHALVLKNDQVDDPLIDGVRIATMHRVKGMEFTCVYIIGVSASQIPPREIYKKAENEEEQHELLKQEANLLSVAMTRAKKAVWITYEKAPSKLLKL